MLKRRKSFALTLTAAAVPAFGLCPSLGWAGALLGGAAAAWILNRTERALRGRSLAKAAACGAVGRAAAAVSALGLFGLALWAAGRSRLAFPETAGSPLAAALIFALSFWAARSGAEAVGRCAAVLLPLLAVLYGVILVFSLSQLRLSWLLPTGTPRAGLRASSSRAPPSFCAGRTACLSAGAPRSPPLRRLRPPPSPPGPSRRPRPPPARPF